MELIDKEVRFDIFCPLCTYKELDDGDDPCNDCLAHPSNQNTRIPQEFRPASESTSDRIIAALNAAYAQM